MTTSETKETHENRLRRQARQKGYVIKKDRAKSRNINHQGGYMIMSFNNTIEAGEKFNLTLDDVEKFLSG